MNDSTNAVETTIVVFKPESRPEHSQIAQQAFRESGFNITASRHVQITQDLIHPIFSNPTHGDYYNLIKSRICGKTLLVWAVSGNEAVRQIRRIVGDRPWPIKCDPSSLRHIIAKKYGFPRPNPRGDYSFAYPVNYIYRSSTLSEAERDQRMLMDNSLIWHPV